MRWPRSTPGSPGIYGKALGPEHPAVAILLNNLGQVEKAEGRYADAEPPIKRSLAIREKVLGRDHPDVARSLNNLADLFERQRHYADAEPLYQRAVANRERALGSDHPDLWTSLNNLAFLYQAVGRTPDALPLVERHRQRTRAAARCPSGVIGRAAATIDAGRTSIGRMRSMRFSALTRERF
jgi:tetratricopeptide (TPR) repeat protein